MPLDTVNQRVRPRLLTGLTALGSSQTTALPLVNDGFHEFTTVASSTGCVLPTPFPSPPSTVTIVNAGANALDVYPQSGGTIANGTVNAPVSLSAGSSVTYSASSLSNWYALQTTPAGTGLPGGTSGQIQYDNGGAFGGFTASGDATINTSTGTVTVTKTNGVAFANSATTDTTNASNIASGVLAASHGGLGVAAGSAGQGVLPIGTGSGFALGTLTAGSNVTITNTAGGITIGAAPGSTSPGGTSGQIQYDNAGAFGGFTASGDATINTSTGAITVTKTNGVPFTNSATTDTTNASNIVSGTLAAAQLPALSGAIVTTAGSAATTFGTIPTLELLANTTGGTAAPAGVTLTSLIDAAIASNQGDLLYRGASTWGPLAPGTAHNPLQTGGLVANPSWNSNLLLPSAGPTRWTTGPFWNVTTPGTAVTNTTTQTSLLSTVTANGTLTIPANSLSTGQSIRMDLVGTWGITASQPTMVLTLYFGSTSFVMPTFTPTATSVTNGLWLTLFSPIVITILSTGANGTCIVRGYVTGYYASATGSAIGIYVGGTSTGVATPATINTTSSNLIDLKLTWGTANASNMMQCTGGFAEIIG